MKTLEKTRYHYLDNTKALLIFLVVLGHLCEISTFTGCHELYMLIYVFHMPAFAFCSGIFATFNKRKILKNLVYPYLIFQTLYIAFDHFVLGNASSLQYTKPYWLMWYMLAMIVWECSLPLFHTISLTKKLAIILLLFGISLWIGLDHNVSYFLSFSRILVLFPFFMLGYYYRQSEMFLSMNSVSYRNSSTFSKIRIILSLLVIAIFLVLTRLRYQINPKWLYGSYSYSALQYNYLIRAGFILCALVIILFILFMMPNIHLPIISAIGTHTLSIFLLHGFLIKLLGHLHVFSRTSHLQYILPLLAICITCFLSNRLLNILLAPLFHFSGKHLHFVNRILYKMVTLILLAQRRIFPPEHRSRIYHT